MPLNTAILKKKQQFTDDVIELEFETSQPFNFVAGQFVTYKIADKIPPCFRAYSISNAPLKDGNILATCLKVVPNGRGSNWLNTLKIGDKVEFMGPSGKLTFKTLPEKLALFIATGTGITPMKSIIEDELAKGNTQKMHLLFGLRYIKDIFYKEHFENLAKNHPNFTFDMSLTRPENDSWAGSKGRVTEILNKTDLDPKNTEVYMCGLKDMILEVTNLLKSKGFEDSAIHDEKYN
ncbi:FAD-dependent oxidoreductase [Candidatus Peregrinibacteria bacterium]|nr:FAD-dependent oxidoreductase [Candidatus Peregrinibacteria bacterium]